MDERNFTYMFYGFLSAWLIVIAYVLTLVARERRIQEKLDHLRRMIDSQGGK